jgi:hypothetical protein
MIASTNVCWDCDHIKARLLRPDRRLAPLFFGSLGGGCAWVVDPFQLATLLCISRMSLSSLGTPAPHSAVVLFACAQMNDVMALADAGGTMPPKST